LGRKNWLFVGSEAAGQRQAVILSLLATAKANGLDPAKWLLDPTFRTYQKHFFDLKCSPLKFTKRVDYKNLQQLQLGSSRLNSRNG
jgi:hypothetical protein